MTLEINGWLGRIYPRADGWRGLSTRIDTLLPLGVSETPWELE
jgi:hypothetical protein